MALDSSDVLGISTFTQVEEKPVREQGGKFLRHSPGGALKIGDDGLAYDAVTIVAKAHGRFVPNSDLPTDTLRAKAAKIARLLAEGKYAEAILFASFIDWRSGATDATTSFDKAGYDPFEPRDEKGRWSSGSVQSAPHVLPVASANDPRGNKMAKDAANAAGLNRAQRRQLHDLITGQGITDFQTILQIAKEIASGGA